MRFLLCTVIPTGAIDSRCESIAEWRDFEFAKGVKAIGNLCLVFVLTVSPLPAKERAVDWTPIDYFCGRIVSAEPHKFPISSVKIKLYRAWAKDLPCCADVEKLDDVHLDKDGNFDLRNLPPSRYWMIASWNKTEVPIALWYQSGPNISCSEARTNVINIKPSTKTTEIYDVASFGSSANAKTH